MKFCQLITIYFLVTIQGFCQDIKPKFGKVSDEELNMLVYEKDSSAGAVILFNIGKLDPNSTKFTRHMRIKVLKKSGLFVSNWVFNTTGKSDFKVVVSNLVDGTLVQTYAEKDNIYREQVIDDFYIYKVFAPKTQVGSVIDIKYSFYGVPYEWYFQTSIPVVYSEVTIPESTRFSFSKVEFGFEPIEKISDIKWVARDMPAFQVEPYLNDVSNYMKKFEFFRKGYYINTDWKFWVNRMLNWSDVGDVFTTSAFLNKSAKSIRALNLPVKDQIKAAYDTIQANIKWDKRKRFWASNDFVQNYRVDHSGSSGDVNLLLIALLKKMKINTDPVLLSTRDNGVMLNYAANITKPNYIIAYVRHEGLEMFVDATSEYLQPGTLPLFCLNGSGLIIEKDKDNWINLSQNRTSDVRTLMSSITISEELNATAEVNTQFQEYGYYKWCLENEKLDMSPEQITQQLEENYDNIDILSYKIIDDFKDDLKVKESINIDMSDKVIDLGNEFIFSPVVFFDYEKNPLIQENRLYPVDFTCPIKRKFIVQLNIPKGYEVSALPTSVKVSNGDETAKFSYAIAKMGESIQINVGMSISKHLFLEHEYPDLKQFFSTVAKKVNEPIHFQLVN